MDPITAAGIGLSIASLSLQLFAGCIKGYELFIDIRELPERYEHLRTRLRIEQSRALHWGEKIGLVEEMLDEPSMLLGLNNNVIFDILQDMQRAFKQCVETTTKYDKFLAENSVTVQSTDMSKTSKLARPVQKPSMLQKTLATWERAGRFAGKLEWRMLKKDSFERLIVQLIHYNDRIESLLDRGTLKEVVDMQEQSNLMLLQITDKVERMHDLIRASNFGSRDDGRSVTTISSSSTIVERSSGNAISLVSLASFKAYYLEIESGSRILDSLFIPFGDIELNARPSNNDRQLATRGSQQIWLEWWEKDANIPTEIEPRALESRVRKLAALLVCPETPAAFRTPKCIGYTTATQGGKSRHALVHKAPDALSTKLMSLRDMFERQERRPSLNARLELAVSLATSVLYLHAVNWLHKDIRSVNVLFAREIDVSSSLKEPILAGFRVSRPALPEESTGTHWYSPQEALYRHPDLLTGGSQRSNKGHDLYSLGLLLAEIAFWEPIEDVLAIEVRMSKAIQVHGFMTDPGSHVRLALSEKMGELYADVAMSCLDGSLTQGLGNDLEGPDEGAELERRLYGSVVSRLRSIVV